MVFSVIRAKTFRTRKNFPGSNAKLLPRFLGLCIIITITIFTIIINIVITKIVYLLSWGVFEGILIITMTIFIITIVIIKTVYWPSWVRLRADGERRHCLDMTSYICASLDHKIQPIYIIIYWIYCIILSGHDQLYLRLTIDNLLLKVSHKL